MRKILTLSLLLFSCGWGQVILNPGGSVTGHSVTHSVFCSAASGSGTIYTCSTTPSFTPVDGDMIDFDVDVTNTGAITLAVNGAPAVAVQKWTAIGSSPIALVAGDLQANQPVWLYFDIGLNIWSLMSPTAKVLSESAIDTTTSHVLHASATGGTGTFSAITTGDLPLAIPIANVGTVGLSGTSPVTISAAGAIGCATCTTAASALTNNSPVLGGGGQATQTATFLTTDGTAGLTIGVVGGGNGFIALGGTTSGIATFTAPSIAGTRTNAVVMSNTLQGPVGGVTTPTFAVNSTSGTFSSGGNTAISSQGAMIVLFNGASGQTELKFGLGFASSVTTSDVEISRATAGVLAVGANETVGDFTGSLKLTTMLLAGTVQNAAGTTTMGLTLKKGTGSGNYTTASTTYAVVDSTNLCFTITIPTGWKLGVSVNGAIGTATGVAVASLALTDNAACSTANAGVLVETTETTTAAAVLQPVGLGWVVTGDGASHSIALQFKTANGADSATLANSSATLLPTMVFTLMPSN